MLKFRDVLSDPPSRKIGTGMIPPQATALEREVLRCMFEEGDSMSLIRPYIKSPEFFYKDGHRVLFQALSEIIKENRTPDFNNLVYHLEKSGELDIVGGRYAITEILTDYPKVKSLRYNSAVVAEMYFRRISIDFFGEMVRRLYDLTEDTFDMVIEASKFMEDLFAPLVSGKARSLDEILDTTIEQISEIQAGGLVGITTGFRDVDYKIKCFLPGDLVIIAGRPSMGKTVFALNICANAAMQGVKVGIISLEMSSEKLASRILARFAEVDGMKFRTKGGLSDEDWYRMSEKAPFIKSLGVEISDSCFSIDEVVFEMKRMAKAGCKLVMIDYLQLCNNSRNRGNLYEKVTDVQGQITQATKENKLVTLELSQLSRNVESRGGDKRPNKADLRQTGKIEEDADFVMFPHRPHYYGFEFMEDGSTSSEGMCEIIIDKARDGAEEGTVYLEYIGKYQKFQDWDDINPFGSKNEPTPPTITPLKDWNDKSDDWEETGDFDFDSPF